MILTAISALSAIAPMIGKMLGGDKGEQAAEHVAGIARAVTGQNDISKAVNDIHLNPEYRAEFLTQMNQNEEAMTSMYLNDRKDARASHRHSKFPAILCSFLTLGLSFFVAALMFVDIPDANMRMLDMIFGSYLTAWIGSCAYWNGTTRGSAEKQIGIIKGH